MFKIKERTSYLLIDVFEEGKIFNNLTLFFLINLLLFCNRNVK